MSYLIKTERLGIRFWRDEDIQPFAALNADEQVMRFFPSTLTYEQTEAMVQRMKSDTKTNGFTFFAVDILATEEFIGFIGLSKPNMQTYFTPCVEIGWRLKASAWGNGYAPEGAKACLEYGFKELGIKEIYSFTPTLNHPSERVMQKIGMTKVGEFDHPKIEKGHRLERHVLYKIKAR